MVTKSTIPTHEWSRKNTPVQIDYKQYVSKTIAVLVGVSAECGVDLVMTYDKSVNIPKFKIFLEELRRRYFFDDLCIYMDNLSVHISNAVKERLEELSIKCIYAPVYSPEYNPIEYCFSVAKGMIKRERLEAILHEKKIDLVKVIHRSFDRIKRESINNCVTHSLRLLNNFN